MAPEVLHRMRHACWSPIAAERHAVERDAHAAQNSGKDEWTGEYYSTANMYVNNNSSRGSLLVKVEEKETRKKQASRAQPAA